MNHLCTLSRFVAPSVKQGLSSDSFRRIVLTCLFSNIWNESTHNSRYQSSLILGTDVPYLCHNKRTKREVKKNWLCHCAASVPSWLSSHHLIAAGQTGARGFLSLCDGFLNLPQYIFTLPSPPDPLAAWNSEMSISLTFQRCSRKHDRSFTERCGPDAYWEIKKRKEARWGGERREGGNRERRESAKKKNTASCFFVSK